MAHFIALLRSVNVGGTGRLPMNDLKLMCEKAGLRNVKTYIASGNVVFLSEKSEAQIKTALEAALKAYASKAVSVFVRTADEMKEVLAANPFANMEPNRTVVIFLDKPPASDMLEHIVGRTNEEVRLGKREIYVHYVDGISESKLKISAANAGTSRNMNTVANLAQLASQL